VQTCWTVGWHIVEFEQRGASRAIYGARLLPELERLTPEFGKGFDASNLRYMRLFYQAFRIRDALRHELSWTHYRSLLRVEDGDGTGMVHDGSVRAKLGHACAGASDWHSLLKNETLGGRRTKPGDTKNH